MWVYASGFPKSANVSKMIDKAAGAEREVVGVSQNGVSGKSVAYDAGNDTPRKSTEFAPAFNITAPATDAAKQWEGWGTALKPAYEPIILARKPLIGSVAANVLRYGTGGINVDGCRIGTESISIHGYTGNSFSQSYKEQGSQPQLDEYRNAIGRWPANLILGCQCSGDAHEQECPVAMLDAQSGERGKSYGIERDTSAHGYDGGWRKRDGQVLGYGDTGGASRFFKIVKGDDVWQSANTAKPSSNQPYQPDDSARNDAATEANREGWSDIESPILYQERLTSETLSESKPSSEIDTQPTRSTGQRYLQESEPENTSPTSLANNAASPTPTGTMRTTDNRSKSDSSVEPVTSPSTSNWKGHGGPDFDGHSRMFYTAKASRAERNKGLEGMPESKPHPDEPNGRTWDIPGSHSTARANHHPTVKPLSLMQWLCRLVTPPGGTVLDPFGGSGSTMVAADREGFHGIYIDMDEEYARIARKRVHGDAPLFAEVAD
jgi:hypothetical protein